MIDCPTLSGDRVRLEPMDIGSVEALVAAASGSRDTYAYALIPPELEGMTKYVEAALEEQAEGLSVPFVIVDPSHEKIVGSTRYMDIVCWDRPGVPSAVEIGSTWLAASVQRTGINTEMKLLMLAHAFETWEVHRVTLKTDARNQRSRTAMERVGCRFEGVRRAHMPALDGGIRDTAYYSILRSEWPAVKERLEALIDAYPPPAARWGSAPRSPDRHPA
ncbi:MAG: GNAT family N-acetyltransferase [Actinobacteria bacterium]|nr:GNAT family N-acetyltransferase [Actinomycetota bacterium]